MIRILALLALLLPGLAQAQSWPIYENTYVNDYANLLEEDAETRVRRQLEVLREETGIEATVLTLFTRKGFEEAGSMETFATGLFNHWGIGDATRNDGILIMVLSEDREMRIELGSGYGAGFDREAQDVIDRVFLPAFQADDMQYGVEAGTDATLTRIARVFHAGEEPPNRANGPSGGSLFALFGALFAAFIGWKVFGRSIRDRFTRCPHCGHRGIHTDEEVLEAATTSAKGRGTRTTRCTSCGYHNSTSYVIPTRSRSSSSSFGGGSSSGGGASGRW
ncbi:TPM domain-containing protein [Aliiroseovarius subalbicans]|uniref:TPM domain-containing protein n=1 Tax=Aliiroseovarius subalbicans TaxID=2925840 RepID=UPI001F5AB962|nr:TPM domain-containing protein [Aliiroseovarius subalbicans]MCI2398728.1 TPM domain-containing protein [Aliiroseovarius subalbicans]